MFRQIGLFLSAAATLVILLFSFWWLAHTTSDWMLPALLILALILLVVPYLLLRDRRPGFRMDPETKQRQIKRQVDRDLRHRKSD